MRLRHRHRRQRRNILRVRQTSPICHRRDTGLNQSRTLRRQRQQHRGRTVRERRRFISRRQQGRGRHRRRPPVRRRLRKRGWLRHRRRTSSARLKPPLANKGSNAPPGNRLPRPNKPNSGRPPKPPPGNALPRPRLLGTLRFPRFPRPSGASDETVQHRLEARCE